jgi:hypothetical protein
LLLLIQRWVAKQENPRFQCPRHNFPVLDSSQFDNSIVERKKSRGTYLCFFAGGFKKRLDATAVAVMVGYNGTMVG